MLKELCGYLFYTLWCRRRSSSSLAGAVDLRAFHLVGMHSHISHAYNAEKVDNLLKWITKQISVILKRQSYKNEMGGDGRQQNEWKNVWHGNRKHVNNCVRIGDILTTLKSAWERLLNCLPFNAFQAFIDICTLRKSTQIFSCFFFRWALALCWSWYTANSPFLRPGARVGCRKSAVEPSNVALTNRSDCVQIYNTPSTFSYSFTRHVCVCVRHGTKAPMFNIATVDVSVFLYWCNSLDMDCIWRAYPAINSNYKSHGHSPPNICETGDQTPCDMASETEWPTTNLPKPKPKCLWTREDVEEQK